MTEREETLTAALLWLRNQYEFQHLNPKLKPNVLAAADRVLAAGGPISGEMSVRFRKRYLHDADGQVTKPGV